MSVLDCLDKQSAPFVIHTVVKVCNLCILFSWHLVLCNAYLLHPLTLLSIAQFLLIFFSFTDWKFFFKQGRREIIFGTIKCCLEQILLYQFGGKIGFFKHFETLLQYLKLLNLLFLISYFKSLLFTITNYLYLYNLNYKLNFFRINS